jgi:23S rRNA (guanine745-N1)-methyltransferase
VGIDLSAQAAGRAARRFPELTWVVANADRRLPLADGSVRLVLSVNGRRNPSECRRVLASEGFLLVAVPAPHDLVELRASVEGEAAKRDRGAGVIEEHTGSFTLTERATLAERHHLDRPALLDLLRGTYRGERRSAAAGVEALAAMDVTLASDVMVFRPT